MTIDLVSITLHFIHNVYLVGTAYKHLRMFSNGVYKSILAAYHHGANEGVTSNNEGAGLLSKGQMDGEPEGSQ